MIGVAPARTMPAFAPESFKSWFARRPVHNQGAKRVLLWPDTFNNYFHPATAKAAVEVLESAGFQVIVPRADLCCGRPLYDYGMLVRAKRWLAQILDVLGDEIEAGTPMIGLEPSCTAVFRDELRQFFPDHKIASRLGEQTFTLAEFLEKHAAGYDLPKLQRKVLLHGHCHQKAIMKMDCEKKLFDEMELDCELLDSGCCGMAGAFGFEKDHYEISIACGERMLLPAVRTAARDTLIIADGFSCREQVRQTTDRIPLHTAEVLKMALAQGPHGPSGNFPERSYIQPEPATPSKWKTLALLVLGLAGLVGVLANGRQAGPTIRRRG
jgi:Fe-S oxidoreductase